MAGALTARACRAIIAAAETASNSPDYWICEMKRKRTAGQLPICALDVLDRANIEGEHSPAAIQSAGPN